MLFLFVFILHNISESSTLAALFGEQAAQPDDDLCDWFVQCAARVGRLSGTAPAADTLELRRLSSALAEVAAYHKVDASAVAKQQVADVQAALDALARLAGVREELLASLAAVGDAGYAWGVLQTKLDVLQVCRHGGGC